MGEIALANSLTHKLTSPGGSFAKATTLTRLLLILLAFALLTVVMTWPLAWRAGDTLSGTNSNALNDSYYGVWTFAWQAHQLLRDPLNLFQGNIFYPFRSTLAFSEIILPEALMYLPLELATGNPILAYNLVILFLFVLNGFTMYLWALDVMCAARRKTKDEGQESISVLRSRPSVHLSAFLAGLIFAFCTYKLGEIRHVQLLSAQFMPLTLMYLGRGLRTPTARHGFLTGLYFVLNALSSLYYAVFLALAMVLYALVDFARRRYRITRAHLVFGATAVVTLALLVPFFIPFLQLEREFHFSAGRDPRLFAARPASYLASLGTNWLYGKAGSAFLGASKGQPLFPGLIVLALAVLGTLVRRWWTVLFAVLLALLGFVLSFGPQLMLDRSPEPFSLIRLPYYWLSVVLTPLASLNAPARFDVLVMLALALLAAFGTEWLAARFPHRENVLFAALAVLILLEYASMPIPLDGVSTGAAISPVYRYLASQPPGQPVVEVPMGKPTFADQDRYVEYTYNSIYHWQPLVNGYSTFIPPKYYALVDEMQHFPTAKTVASLKKWGAVFVVFHSNKLPTPQRYRAALASTPGIEHVQDFGKIWLYRIK